MTRFGFSIAMVGAVSAAAVLFAVTSGLAGTVGNAPWCAVISMGDGDVHWDCEYNSVEACVPNVLAGNRGFCNVNPYWTGGAALTTTPVTHRKRHTATRPG